MTVLVLAASLPGLARFIFLGQVLGAAVFLVWVLRSWHLPVEAAETHGLTWRTIRAVAKIGLVLLPAAFLANIFGYVNLGNLLGIVFLRSVYIAAVLYTAIRIIEGTLIQWAGCGRPHFGELLIKILVLAEPFLVIIRGMVNAPVLVAPRSSQTTRVALRN